MVSVIAAVPGFHPAKARASMVIESFTFTATDFQFTGPDIPPATTISGSFSLTFDPTTDYPQTVDGLDLVSTTPSLLLQSGVGFYYQPDNEGGRLLVGGLENGVGEDDDNTSDFFVVFNDVQTSPAFERLVYTESGYLAGADSTVGTVVTTVPEPAGGLAFLAAAGAGLLLRGRRNRWQKVANFAGKAGQNVLTCQGFVVE